MVVAILLIALVNSMVTNDRFEWNVVGDYLFSSRILHGLVITLELTGLRWRSGSSSA